MPPYAPRLCGDVFASAVLLFIAFRTNPFSVYQPPPSYYTEAYHSLKNLDNQSSTRAEAPTNFRYRPLRFYHDLAHRLSSLPFHKHNVDEPKQRQFHGWLNGHHWSSSQLRSSYCCYLTRRGESRCRARQGPGQAAAFRNPSTRTRYSNQEARIQGNTA